MHLGTGTYISANSFSFVTDQTANCLQNVALLIDSNGTWVTSHVGTAVYSGGITTVTLTTSVLETPVGDVFTGLVPAALPRHNHIDDGSGGSEVVGLAPDHEWSDTLLRFRTPTGDWGTQVNLIGPQGIQGIQGVAAVWYFGTDAPNDSTGNDGDCYLRTSTWDVYKKASGTWGSIVGNIKGAQGIQGIQGPNGSQIFVGSGTPDNGTGVQNDIYIRFTGDVYQKGASVWGSVLFNVMGPQGNQGNPGSQIILGSTVPSDGSGNDADFYLRTTTGDYYKKTSGTWGSIVGSLKGPTGDTGATGATGSVSAASAIILTEISSESTPSAGELALYAKTDKKLYTKDEAGTETQVGAGSGGGGAITNVQASRPSAGTTSRIFLPTDGLGPSGLVQYDNGSSWDNYVNGFKCTNPPGSGTLTAVSVGSETTLVADGDGQLFTQKGTNSSTEMQAAYVTAVPGGAYSFIVGLELKALMQPNYNWIGICLTNGTSNPATITYRMWFNYTSNARQCDIAKYSAMGTPSGSYSGYPTPVYPPFTDDILFLKIHDDTTNRIFSFSKDGKNWIDIHSVGRTDFLTPTHCGIIAGQASGVVATTIVRSQMKIFHWTLS